MANKRGVIYAIIWVLVAVLIVGGIVVIGRSPQIPESPSPYEIVMPPEPPIQVISVPDIPVRETETAPFTVEEREFFDRIVEEMLAGNYEYAAKLLASGVDLLNSVRETYGFSGFRYRDIFRFNFHVESNMNVRMNKVEDGEGLFVFLHYNHLYATRNIRYVEYVDGSPNGRFMNKLFQSDFLRWIETGYVVDGRVHGVFTRTEWGFRRDYPIESILLYSDGFLQAIGPQGEDGHMRSSIITDAQGIHFGYLPPASFERPWYVTDFLLLWETVLPYSPWFV